MLRNFNPPSAPHTYGLCEDEIKSTKVHLGKVVGETILTLEEFNAVLVEIEAILNSRPLCATESDDMEVLTPAHFLIHRPLTLISETTNIQMSITSRWSIIKKNGGTFLATVA